MNRSFTYAIAFAAVLVPATMYAQLAADLHQGVRIRVTTSNGRRIVGNYAGRETDSVSVVQNGVQNIRMSVAASDVSKIEVSKGRNRGQGAVRKSLIGLGVGLASGALLGAVSYSKPNPKTCASQPDPLSGLVCADLLCIFVCSRGQSAGFGGALGGIAGFLFGGFYGLATGHESWAEVGDHTAR